MTQEGHEEEPDTPGPDGALQRCTGALSRAAWSGMPGYARGASALLFKSYAQHDGKWLLWLQMWAPQAAQWADDD